MRSLKNEVLQVALTSLTTPHLCFLCFYLLSSFCCLFIHWCSVLQPHVNCRHAPSACTPDGRILRHQRDKELRIHPYNLASIVRTAPCSFQTNALFIFDTPKNFSARELPAQAKLSKRTDAIILTDDGPSKAWWFLCGRTSYLKTIANCSAWSAEGSLCMNAQVVLLWVGERVH
jgi:hypothetical protein